MTDKMLNMISDFFQLEEKSVADYQNIKVSIFKFSVRAFDAKNLGNVSVMTGKALFGLMKMDTVVINPFDKDMPLFSYDRIYAMGKDTLFLEMFDTRISNEPFSDKLEKILKEYSNIPEQPTPPNWYDNIRLPGCRKKSGKADSPVFDTITQEYLKGYLEMCNSAESCDRQKKIKVSRSYTEGLLSNGGPSTDQFVKAKGREFTGKLFRDFLFGTGNPEK